MKDSRYYLIQETKNTSRNQFIPPHLLTAFSLSPCVAPLVLARGLLLELQPQTF